MNGEELEGQNRKRGRPMTELRKKIKALSLGDSMFVEDSISARLYRNVRLKCSSESMSSKSKFKIDFVKGGYIVTRIQ